MKFFKLAIILIIAGLLSSCATKETTVKEIKRTPVDCANAEQQIAYLEKQKASSGEQVKSGTKSILPPAAIVNMMGGTFKENVRVSSGEYNKAISNKIDEIEHTCELHHH